MKTSNVLLILWVTAIFLFACDQAGEFVLLQGDESMQKSPLAKTASKDEEDDCGCRDIEATLISSADFSMAHIGFEVNTWRRRR